VAQTPPPLPLSTLLAQVLVAYTIEFDNLAELRLPHHTSDDDRDRARARDERSDTPWLASYVCWANVLQYVGPDGLTVATLRDQARTDRLLLEGLRRWRYLRLTPPQGQALKKPSAAATLVRTTHHGRLAQEIWGALPAIMDERWRGRFGDKAVERLHRALAAIFTRLPIDPPAFLPVVHPTQNGRAETAPPGPPSHRVAAGTADFVTLLAGVLLSFTIDFEADSRVSLPVSANTLRVLDRAPRRPRDLPRLTGVSKEGNAMCIGFLERRACVVVEPDPAATRGKVIRLTDKGEAARAKSERLLAATEERWRTTYGPRHLAALRAALEPLVGGGTLDSSPLAAGLTPEPGNWRASVNAPETLPHYPMVLHRGGFPDGS
jgi:DNA-binding MarR family transcriptional regulator